MKTKKSGSEMNRIFLLKFKISEPQKFKKKTFEILRF